MENKTLTPQPTEKKKFSGLAALEIGLLEISFVLIGILGLLGIFNYFNVLPVSSNIPFFSFLPTQKSSNLNKTTNNNLPAQNQKIIASDFLGCPVSPNLCIKGVKVSAEKNKISNFSGIGFPELGKDEEILAAIDGKLNISTQSAGIVTIESSSKNIIVTYEFPQGAFDGSSSGDVRKGDVIGKITDPIRTISDTAGKFNIIFYSQALHSKIIDKIKVSPDGKGILNAI